MRSADAAAWRFLVVGLINTALGYVIFLALAFLMPTTFAYIVSYCIGIGFAVVANLRWTFRRKLNIRAVVLSGIVYLGTMTVGTFFIQKLDQAGVDVPIIGLAVTLMGITMNFIGMRLIARRIAEAPGSTAPERQSS